MNVILADSSEIVDFYLHDGVDNNGRTLKDYYNYTHKQLECSHNYIQWMFPINEISSFNSHAPILTKDDVNYMKLTRVGCERIAISFHIYLDFLLFSEQRCDVFSYKYNHNHLRITRVLKCLSLFELIDLRDSFFAVLKLLFNNDWDKSESVPYWENVIKTNPWQV